jgi:hypothetical protein
MGGGKCDARSLTDEMSNGGAGRDSARSLVPYA